MNNCFADILFNSGADKSFISNEFSKHQEVVPIELESSSPIELKNGKKINATHVLYGCKLGLLGHILDIDLMPITLGSFDVIVNKDWLSKNQAEIICSEKITRIPLRGEESLSAQGERTDDVVSIISFMKAQKCLRKGHLVILAHVSETLPERKKLEDILFVCDFPEINPEDLHGLPPHHQVEFQIELTPEAAPLSRATYRLAPVELQELSKQLQELLEMIH